MSNNVISPSREDLSDSSKSPGSSCHSSSSTAKLAVEHKYYATKRQWQRRVSKATSDTVNLNVNKKMANSYFAVSNEDLLQNLNEKASNDNTKNTQTKVNAWNSWAVERNANPSIE